MAKPCDDRIMMEAYLEDRQKTEQEIIDEGLLDRMKARGAGLKAGVKSIGGRVKGATQTAVGKAAGALGADEAGQQLQQMGQDTTAGAKAQTLDAKSLSIIEAHLNKLQTEVTDFNNDLKKLGMDPDGAMKETNPDAAAAMTGLRTAVNNLMGNLTGKGSRGQAYGRLQQAVNPPAPAPAAAPAPAPAAGAPAPTT